jgi:hypothetical protein
MKFFITILILAAFAGSAEAKSTTYTGTVTPILQCVYKAGTNYPFMGLIKKVPRVGEIVHPPVLDPDGKIITPGSILVQSQLLYHTASMLAAKDKMKGLKYELNTDRENYLRYKKLSKSTAVSLEKFDNEEADYYATKGSYEVAKAQLIQEQAVLKAMTDIAPFTAIIDNVFRPIGAFMNEHEAVELSQLNPIAVNVKMDNDIARKITTSTPVKIYPIGENKPIGVFHGFGQRIRNGYQFAVYNSPKYGSTIDFDGRKVPVVDNVNTVFPFYFIKNRKKLGVPLKSILKDDSGYYVWKGVGLKNMQPGKGLKEVFPVKKVYVKPGNLKRNQAGYTTYQILNDPGELELYDIILVDPPEKIKNNSLVCYPKNDYSLMPGDRVKVVIGER